MPWVEARLGCGSRGSAQPHLRLVGGKGRPAMSSVRVYSKLNGRLRGLQLPTSLTSFLGGGRGDAQTGG